ncbi:hypothetical protein RRG08_016817 [Elysia crispata]|uniref:Uncharacterized protein n=1 Tax=Elysia crispata TaxID=231223 RepID=A0AAE0ZZU6_9GAST|nr:hypothetical protein RRG08_016817 [Elysia crispata]
MQADEPYIKPSLVSVKSTRKIQFCGTSRDPGQIRLYEPFLPRSLTDKTIRLYEPFLPRSLPRPLLCFIIVSNEIYMYMEFDVGFFGGYKCVQVSFLVSTLCEIYLIVKGDVKLEPKLAEAEAPAHPLTACSTSWLTAHGYLVAPETRPGCYQNVSLQPSPPPSPVISRVSPIRQQVEIQQACGWLDGLYKLQKTLRHGIPNKLFPTHTQTHKHTHIYLFPEEQPPVLQDTALLILLLLLNSQHPAPTIYKAANCIESRTAITPVQSPHIGLLNRPHSRHEGPSRHQLLSNTK